ncbi:hypothetical protein NCS55_01251800 [Fusarium keratoplasticum]|nr:hypothetical protein NCS55_01251800 [Fusarium keratoplasticum]
MPKNLSSQDTWSKTDTKCRECDAQEVHVERARNGDLKPEPEAERKFQTWSATTIGLLLDAQNAEEQSQIQEWQENERARITDCLFNTFDTMAKFREQDVEDEFSSIISEAFVVGKEISRQISRITWTFDPDKGQEKSLFNEETMELETGDHVKPRVVNWVVAPGVMKRVSCVE